MKHIIFYLIFIFAITSCSDGQTIIIDEEVSSNEKLKALDSSKIFSVAKWHKGDAPPRYDAHKDSELVIVKTKMYESQLQKDRHLLLSQLIDKAGNEVDILMILNGEVVSKGKLTLLKKLEPEDLKSVETLSKEVAESIYGDNAKSENILINTYDLKTDLINE